MNSYPACFNSQAEYDLWKEARSMSVTRCPPCEDCTVDYKVEMCLQERCAHPEVRFRLDEDGFMEGYIPALGNGPEIADKAIRMVKEYPVKITRSHRRFKVSPVQYPQVGELIGVYSAGVTVEQIEEDMREVV